MLEYATAFSGLNLASIVDKLAANPQMLIALGAAVLVIVFLTTRKRR